MKYCRHCGETNADANNTCWKCGDFLAGSAQTKFCNNCHETCITDRYLCPMCGGTLLTHEEIQAAAQREQEALDTSSSSDSWMIVVAILLPLLGFILGILQVAKNDNKSGRTIIIVSLVSAILFSAAVLYYIRPAWLLFVLG